jgi:hypothetical protein
MPNLRLLSRIFITESSYQATRDREQLSAEEKRTNNKLWPGMEVCSMKIQ